MNKLTKVAAVAIAASFFKSYPTVNTFHVTEDEQVFENANDALNNAKQLDVKNPVVHAVNRDETHSIQLDEQTLSDNPDLKTGKAKATKTKPAGPDDIVLEEKEEEIIEQPDNTVTAKSGGDDAALSTAGTQADNAKANATTKKAVAKAAPAKGAKAKGKK